MFSGHDWRTAIGPRDGYFHRCRRCYATQQIDHSPAAAPRVTHTSGPVA
jgi:hypothetical protein